MPVYLIQPVPPSPDHALARGFTCEVYLQALDLTSAMARAGLTIEVWDGARLVGCARRVEAW